MLFLGKTQVENMLDFAVSMLYLCIRLLYSCGYWFW